MNAPRKQPATTAARVKLERTFQRFTIGQRWEHAILILSVTGLLFTGLPQKYQTTDWSQWLISSPERLAQIQQIHHIFALLLIADVLYHLFRGIRLMARRRLPEAIFPTWQDLRDAWQMIKFLLFLTRKKPVYGKYNFEQKFTYWFLFFGFGILVLSGLVLWFPVAITHFLPGGIVPAAYLAHSNEAIVAAVFIVIWHFYHVHFQRLNLSIFTGRLSEDEMRDYHSAEYQRLSGEAATKSETQGGSQ